MATRELRKISPEDLKRILEEHRLWLESNGKDGKKAGLSRTDLTGVDLSNADLSKANLLKANLLKANLSGAKLTGVDLRLANLSEASMMKTRLEWANLTGAVIQNACLEGAILEEAKLAKANFKGTNLSLTKLSGARLVDANLLKVNLSHAKLSGANLTRARLSGARLDYANLSEAKLEDTDLSWASLYGTNLSKAYLKGTILKKTDLQGAVLDRAELRGINLKGSNFSRAHLDYSILERINFHGAKFVRASFYKANLEGVDLRNADLTATNLSGANLCHVKLSGVNFEAANFEKIKIDKDTIVDLPQKIVEEFGHTFFVLGYEPIVRSIEFPPEYHKAGMTLLQNFGDVLRSKYPERKTKIRLEQEGLKVTMVVETLEGEKETVENALIDYGLVVSGKMPPEQFTDDPNLILEIKNELNYARARIESQRELIQYQKNSINNLNNLLIQFTKQPPQPIEVNIPVSPSINANIQQTINVGIAPQVSIAQGSLSELKEKLRQGSEDLKTLDELQNTLDQIDKSSSPDEVAKSSAMSKFRRFLSELGDEESSLSKTIKGIKKGTDIARELAGTYNDIAQWCGLPQVPKPFTKK
jgi:uncharacterized protein YjbI with pentapeptide repeats